MQGSFIPDWLSCSITE